MKLKIIMFFSFIFLSVDANSQTIPLFKIHETNGKVINSSSLINNKPVVLIYFSPDCEHCTTLLAKVFKQIDQFKKATIALVSFMPLTDVAAFEKLYHTNQYKNMIVGTEEPVLFVKNLYNLESTPFTMLFNKAGKLIVSYKKETPLNDLINHLRNLK